MKNRNTAAGWRSHLTVLFAVCLALLPRLACPCQMPAYAGLIGSMGMAFLMKTTYLFPLIAVCLSLSVGGLAVGANRRQGYVPFWVGLLAAVVLMIGKFALAWDPVMYGGIALLLIASVWNSWPRKSRGKLRFGPDGEIETNGAPTAK